MNDKLNPIFSRILAAWAAGIQAAAAQAEKDQKDQGKNSRNGE